MTLGVTPSQRRNSAFAGDGLKYDTLQDELDAFDALPRVLRQMVDQSATKLSAVSVLNAYRQLMSRGIGAEGAIRRVLERLVDLEKNEIEVFAGRYEGEYRSPLPHKAADASIVRYATLISSRTNRVTTPPARTRGL